MCQAVVLPACPRGALLDEHPGLLAWTHGTAPAVLTEQVGLAFHWPQQLIKKQVLTPSSNYCSLPGSPVAKCYGSLQSCRSQESGREQRRGRITFSRLGADLICRPETALCIWVWTPCWYGKAMLTYCSNLISTRTKRLAWSFFRLLTAFKSLEALLP